jgi:hypothetical protein
VKRDGPIKRSGLILGLLAANVWPGAAGAVPITPEGKLNYPAVNCVIDGIPLRCVLDTGDNATATVPATPATAHLPLISAAHVLGAAGVVVPIDRVKVEAIHAGNITVTQPTEVFRQERAEGYAVLGRGFFQATRTVTFDFRTMALTADGPSGGACPGAFHLAALLEVPAEFDGKPIQAGWDTAAGFTVVDTAVVARNPGLFQYVKDMPATDATDRSVPTKIYTTNALAICGHKIDNLPVAALDLSTVRAKLPTLPNMSAMPEVVFGDNLLMGHVWSFDFSNGNWTVN